MATVCVGCGFQVVGGKLTILGSAPGGQTDVGIVCDEESGGVDYVVPSVVRRLSTTKTKTTALVSSIYVAGLTPADYATEHDSGSGVIGITAGGAFYIYVDGIYVVSSTGCPVKQTDETDKIIGGRTRISVSGGSILASSGFVTYDPNVDITETGAGAGDGPEYCCSYVGPLSAGDTIVWDVLAQGDAAGIDVNYGVSTLASIARLGSLRS